MTFHLLLLGPHVEELIILLRHNRLSSLNVIGNEPLCSLTDCLSLRSPAKLFFSTLFKERKNIGEDNWYVKKYTPSLFSKRPKLALLPTTKSSFSTERRRRTNIWWFSANRRFVLRALPRTQRAYSYDDREIEDPRKTRSNIFLLNIFFPVLILFSSFFLSLQKNLC